MTSQIYTISCAGRVIPKLWILWKFGKLSNILESDSSFLLFIYLSIYFTLRNGLFRFGYFPRYFE